MNGRCFADHGLHSYDVGLSKMESRQKGPGKHLAAQKKAALIEAREARFRVFDIFD